MKFDSFFVFTKLISTENGIEQKLDNDLSHRKNISPERSVYEYDVLTALDYTLVHKGYVVAIL